MKSTQKNYPWLVAKFSAFCGTRISVAPRNPCSEPHDYRLVSGYQLNAHFLYSIIIYTSMLHYNPQHVSSSTLLIFSRTNFIIKASGIVNLCKRLYSMQVESELQSAFNRHTVRPFTESDDTGCCNNKICPTEEEQSTARNMLRIFFYI